LQVWDSPNPIQRLSDFSSVCRRQQATSKQIGVLPFLSCAFGCAPPGSVRSIIDMASARSAHQGRNSSSKTCDVRVCSEWEQLLLQ
jgi:hypothetical protein